jgi:hypothetical protein
MTNAEYSIAVWIDGTCKLNLCVEHGNSVMSTEDAAQWGYQQALKRNIVTADQPCDVDVSIDASDDWQTFTMPVSAVLHTADGDIYSSPRQ